MPTFLNVVTPAHRENRSALGARFPAACSFLVHLAGLHDESGGRFHLGTDQNLHLYLDNRFLAYVRIEKVRSSAPSLLFSPKPNNDVKHGTKQEPNLLFPKVFVDLIEKHRGGSGGWAKRESDRDVEVFRIGPGAPAQFFEDLLANLRTRIQ